MAGEEAEMNTLGSDNDNDDNDDNDLVALQLPLTKSLRHTVNTQPDHPGSQEPGVAFRL